MLTSPETTSVLTKHRERTALYVHRQGVTSVAIPSWDEMAARRPPARLQSTVSENRYALLIITNRVRLQTPSLTTAGFIRNGPGYRPLLPSSLRLIIKHSPLRLPLSDALPCAPSSQTPSSSPRTSSPGRSCTPASCWPTTKGRTRPMTPGPRRGGSRRTVRARGGRIAVVSAGSRRRGSRGSGTCLSLSCSQHAVRYGTNNVNHHRQGAASRGTRGEPGENPPK